MTQPDKDSVERLAELEADLAFMTENRNKWQDAATQRHNEKLALQARVDALTKLDMEYGKVESAIIMADRDFDGDSDHADCGERLIDSVQRIADQRDAAIKQRDEALAASAELAKRMLESRVDTLTGMLNNIQSEKRECLSRLNTAIKERDEARATILEQDEELAILRPMELIVKDLAQGPQLGSVMYRWMDDLIRRAKAALPPKLRHDSPNKSLIKDEFKG